jgi:hypothetical protein
MHFPVDGAPPGGRGKARTDPGAYRLTRASAIVHLHPLLGGLGCTHRMRVLVIDDGFLFEERRYRSLSQVAAAITGTAWSGPRFFGLKTREVASGQG